MVHISKIQKGHANAGCRPRLMFSRMKDDGTGTAIQVELHPATLDHQGSIMLEFAKQDSKGFCDLDGYHDGSFDWQNSLKFRVRLGIVASMLYVLEGTTNHICTANQDNQVEIKRKNDTVYLRVDGMTERSTGLVEAIIIATVDNGGDWWYRLDSTEVQTLRLALMAAMDRLAWGDR